MPEAIDQIIPLNDEPLKEGDEQNAASKLEKIAAVMYMPAVAEFAFERKLSLSILGDKLQYEESEFSIHIPISSFGNTENFLMKLRDCIKPKKKKLFF